MAAVRGFAFTALVVIFLAAPTVAGAGTSDVSSFPGVAEIRVTGGLRMTGAFDGECDAFAVRPRAPGSEGLEVVHAGGRLVTLSTVVASAPISTVPGAAIRQSISEEPWPPGPLTLGWDGGDGTALVLRAVDPFTGLSASQGELTARFSSPRVDVGSVQPVLPMAEKFWKPAPGALNGNEETRQVAQQRSVTWAPSYLSKRLVDPGAVALEMEGTLSLYLRSAWFQQDGQVRRAMPGYADAAPGGLTTTYTEAFLLLDGARFELPRGAEQLSCKGLRGTNDGEFFAESATGTVVVGTQSARLAGERLAMAGTFELAQDGRMSTPEQIDAVATSLDGTFTALAVDHEIVRAGLPISMGEASLGLVAVLVAAAFATLRRTTGFIGLLWTRIRGRNVLDHPRRRQLHETLVQSPGCNLTDLSRNANLAVGVLRYHLSMLEGANLVDRIRNGRSVRFYALHGDKATGRARLLVRADERYSFLARLLAPNPAPQAHVEVSLAARFGITRRGARKIIAVAEKHGIVTRDKTLGGVRLRPDLQG